MPISEVMYKDKDGFHYKHPERSCNRCMKYPCLKDMDKLKSDFAKYGCVNYSDINIFSINKDKK